MLQCRAFYFSRKASSVPDSEEEEASASHSKKSRKAPPAKKLKISGTESVDNPYSNKRPSKDSKRSSVRQGSGAEDSEEDGEAVRANGTLAYRPYEEAMDVDEDEDDTDPYAVGTGSSAIL